MSTLLVVMWEYSCVAADALATQGAGASAAMVLKMLDRLILDLCEEGFQLPALYISCGEWQKTQIYVYSAFRVFSKYMVKAVYICKINGIRM